MELSIYSPEIKHSLRKYTHNDPSHESGQETNPALQGEADDLKQTRHFESRVDTSRAVTSQKKRMVTRMSMMFSLIIVCYLLSYFRSLVILVLRQMLHDFRYLDFTEVQFFTMMFIERFVFNQSFHKLFYLWILSAELWNTLKYQMKRIYIRTNDSFQFFITWTNISTIHSDSIYLFHKNYNSIIKIYMCLLQSNLQMNIKKEMNILFECVTVCLFLHKIIIARISKSGTWHRFQLT